RTPLSTPFPYTTLFRSPVGARVGVHLTEILQRLRRQHPLQYGVVARHPGVEGGRGVFVGDRWQRLRFRRGLGRSRGHRGGGSRRSEEHTSEVQSRENLV